MEHEVRLPSFGMGMSDAEVTEWFAQEGDTITAAQDLVEVETEKSTAVVEAPVGGVLLRIAAPVGEVVDVTGLLGVIETPA
jgi:pyruvate/2-oxoglutarate dehydrogenase complex dihydrolipoamide acyltransferase (E2) component